MQRRSCFRSSSLEPGPLRRPNQSRYRRSTQTLFASSERPSGPGQELWRKSRMSEGTPVATRSRQLLWEEPWRFRKPRKHLKGKKCSQGNKIAKHGFRLRPIPATREQRNKPSRSRPTATNSEGLSLGCSPQIDGPHKPGLPQKSALRSATGIHEIPMPVFCFLRGQ